jgi:hypothetical protein
MNILEKISAKQLLVLMLVIGYIFFKTEYPKDIVYSIFERFNISKKMQEINKNKLNNEKLDLDSSTLLNTSNKSNSLIEDEINIDSSKDDEDIFCNKKISIENQMLKCLLNKKHKSKNELVPVNFIPYNYQTNLDNNILYSLNKDYKEKKLNHEKKQSGSVVAVNQKMIHKNFDRDIDYYKINRRRDTILNLDSRKNACYVNDLVKFPKKLKCFLRIEDEFISANWNIPILPEHYFPKKINIAICRSNNFNLDKAEVYELPFVIKSSKFESDCFSINTYALDNRVIFNFKSDKYQWQNQKKKCIQLSMKILFFFKFYDKKHRLGECFMESNISNLL